MNVYKRIKQFFSPSKKENQNESIPLNNPEIDNYLDNFEELKEGEVIEDIFDKSVQKKPDYDNNIDLLNLHILIGSVGNRFRKIGIYDGGLGLSGSYIKKSADEHAQIIQDFFSAKYKSIYAKLKVRRKMLKEHEENAKEDLVEHRNFIKQKFKKPTKYSFPLGVLYLLVALFLIFADIPLALKLTQEGFDLDLSWSEDGSADISRLFLNTSKVIIQNWEVVILAMGIALCTIYIKTLYDEYISPPVHKLLPHRMAEMKERKYIDNQEKIDRIIKFRKRMRIGILIILLATIVSLGIFRVFNTPSLEDMNGVKVFVTGLTFVCITIIFPLIGGVCFSLGFENLSNSSRRYFYLWKVKKLSVYQKRAHKELAEVEESQKAVKEYIKWSKKKGFKEHYVESFLASYRHGYEQGSLRPDSYNNGTDLFSRTEKLRNKMISREIFNRLEKKNREKINTLNNSLNQNEGHQF